MGKLDLAIKALTELPAHRQDEIADLVLELAKAVTPPGSALTPEQLEEAQRRHAEGFRKGDATRIDQLLVRLA
jgi:hypothetical protein